MVALEKSYYMKGSYCRNYFDAIVELADDYEKVRKVVSV
jgi:hypothetical protein